MPTPLIAEVISIGDEMTSGARLDTNSQWLSTQLSGMGIRVLYHTTVGDSMEACVRVFRAAARRAGTVVLTGGLGPTADDLTRQALAEAGSTSLELRPEAFEHIERIFAGRGRPMPEANRVQACFPLGSRIIPNPQGTAPGIDMELSDARLVAASPSKAPAAASSESSRFFALPGVPVEMREMFEATVRSRLAEYAGIQQVIRRAVIKCFGLGESDMEARLGDLIARRQSPQVGITVSKATISLRIEAIAESEALAEQQIDAVRQQVDRLVGPYVFGEGESFELQHAVAKWLRQRGERVTVVELGRSCLITGWLAAIEPAEVLAGGYWFESGTHALQHWSLQSPPRASAEPGTTDRGSNGAPMTDAETIPDWLAQVSRTAAERSAAEWSLVVDSYPSLQAAPGQSLPAAETSLVVAGPPDAAGVRPLFHRRTLLAGHPEILQPRIAKTGLALLNDRLQLK